MLLFSAEMNNHSEPSNIQNGTYQRVKIGEFTRAELAAPSGIVDIGETGKTKEISNWEAMRLILEGLGGQAIAMTMNGHGSPTANETNSRISREIGRYHRDAEVLRQKYVYTVTGLLPAQHADKYERI